MPYLVNICDEELLGTTVKGDKIEMEISREYFGAEKVNENQAISLVRNGSIINLAGSGSWKRLWGKSSPRKRL